MAQTTTGQLDQMIEIRINQKINEFAESITAQIVKFLEDNGQHSPTRIEVPDGWEAEGNHGVQKPKILRPVYTSDFKKSLAAGIAKTVKDRMIAKATKDLLEKVQLLS